MNIPSFPEVWGALFFLANKVFFSAKEHARQEVRKTKFSVWSWSLYLIGLAPVAWLLCERKDWMAAAVEVGGVPSMVLGLVRAVKKLRRRNTSRLERFEKPMRLLSYFATCIGVIASVYYYGGLATQTQYCELVLSIGFLVGTMNLAEDKHSGYLWYVPMHIATALLFWLQGGSVFVICQFLSLVAVIYAYVLRGRRAAELSVVSP